MVCIVSPFNQSNYEGANPFSCHVITLYMKAVTRFPVFVYSDSRIYKDRQNFHLQLNMVSISLVSEQLVTTTTRTFSGENKAAGVKD